jgi:hypothetical protein
VRLPLLVRIRDPRHGRQHGVWRCRPSAAWSSSPSNPDASSSTTGGDLTAPRSSPARAPLVERQRPTTPSPVGGLGARLVSYSSWICDRAPQLKRYEVPRTDRQMRWCRMYRHTNTREEKSPSKREKLFMQIRDKEPKNNYKN